MSQSNLVRDVASEKKTVLRMKIKVPRFDNSALIQGYAQTLIGRCMNPLMHDMKS